MVKLYVREAAPFVNYEQPGKVSDYAAGEAILNAPKELQLQCLCIAYARLIKRNNYFYGGISTSISFSDVRYRRLQGTRALVNRLFRRKLPWTPKTLAYVIGSAANIQNYLWEIPFSAVITTAEKFMDVHTPTPEIKNQLRRLRSRLKAHNYAEARKAVLRLDKLLVEEHMLKKVFPLAGDAWANKALEDLEKLSSARQNAWSNFFSYLQTAKGSKPSKKWLKNLEPQLASIDSEYFETSLISWFVLAGKPGNRPRRFVNWGIDPNLLFDDANADLLKGLAWACSLLDSPEISDSLGRLAEICYKKIPNHGSKSTRVANAAVIALQNIGSDEALAQLNYLNQRIKLPSAKKQIEKALLGVAKQRGISVGEMEEQIVPDFGLNADGCIEEEMGSTLARIIISANSKTQTEWLRSDGKALKNPPRDIKESYSAEIKALRKKAKDVQSALHTHKRRIEKLYLEKRKWRVDAWRKYYLDHPLISHIARKLIWQFTAGSSTEAGIWHKHQLVNIDGQPLEWIDDDTAVELWHPIAKPAEVVQTWRNGILDQQISQPFKQAHREIYIVTDAELNTETYSNRFAAHIIKQHQFQALCQVNGWKYQLQGQWDSHNIPILKIPAWEISAEFLVDYPGDVFNTTDVSPSGVFTLVSTDQVRFFDEGNAQIDMQDVPDIVFSEVMRTVDMFVSVCSIGADPSWFDGRNGHEQYWQAFSFGDLNVSSRNRREILASLVPRLKIGKQCQVTDKFLVVQGSYTKYKIHIGSGNILMEPNNQYLCIVPDRRLSETDKNQVHLPFEGDNMLAIILSKAFMLADDTNIKDNTILSQIKRRK